MHLHGGHFSPGKYAISLGAILSIFAGILFGVAPGAVAATQPAVRALKAEDMQNLIFIWASGTTTIQQQASQICRSETISAQNCAAISAAVRGSWLDLMQADPASLGRIGARANPAGSTRVYTRLAGQLSALTHGQEPLLLAQTQQTLRQLEVALQAANGQAQSAGSTSYTVWATSFTRQSSLDSINAKTGQYVAMPDAYIKFANLGEISNIPSIYQPFYVPNGTKTKWSVNISLPDGSKHIGKVRITDVGPWNEDDNWWDPNGVSSTPPPGCPVSSNLIAKDATSNPLVNGICPDSKNRRRMYYYLLYMHAGLPFYSAPSYSPTGNFADGTNWPTALPQGCAETVVASLNNDGITCGGGPSGYNANNGGWLRDGTYDQGITNQSSIDLSPGVDKALGWTYPSSGLIKVNVGGLP
ncbi:MAG TPA: hypothetical protein VFA09_02190 [Ktedonobacteraceae bacterium]|nr:hypothetical protein [Ktedonobacteraceae bacterium]